MLQKIKIFFKIKWLNNNNLFNFNKKKKQIIEISMKKAFLKINYRVKFSIIKINNTIKQI